MRIIELKFANSYYIDHRGCNCHFKKGVPKQVSDQLADKLLATGDFVDIILDDPAFNVPVDTPPEPVKEPVVIPKVPVVAVLNGSFNKLEVATDLKKENTQSKKHRRKKKKEKKDVTD